MKLENLKAPAPNQKTRKRLGRGEGSGLGQQSGKGHKGQRAISGYNHKIGFEGGQMPLQRRIPKYGFKNPFRVEYKGVNLDSIQSYVNDGKLTNTITVADLIKVGLADTNDKVKLLGRGEISKAVNIHVHGFSKTAETKVTNAGGSVTKVEVSNS
jgi:large subunit ribosomal protein L15